jgi:hypothetical protein
MWMWSFAEELADGCAPAGTTDADTMLLVAHCPGISGKGALKRAYQANSFG